MDIEVALPVGSDCSCLMNTGVRADEAVDGYLATAAGGDVYLGVAPLGGSRVEGLKAGVRRGDSTEPAFEAVATSAVAEDFRTSGGGLLLTLMSTELWIDEEPESELLVLPPLPLLTAGESGNGPFGDVSMVAGLVEVLL